MRPLNPDRLSRCLAVRGLTHQQLAVKAGLSEATIWSAMRGRSVRPATVAAIARVLTEVPPLEGADVIVQEVA